MKPRAIWVGLIGRCCRGSTGDNCREKLLERQVSSNLSSTERKDITRLRIDGKQAIMIVDSGDDNELVQPDQRFETQCNLVVITTSLPLERWKVRFDSRPAQYAVYCVPPPPAHLPVAAILKIKSDRRNNEAFLVWLYHTFTHDYRRTWTLAISGDWYTAFDLVAEELSTLVHECESQVHLSHISPSAFQDAHQEMALCPSINSLWYTDHNAQIGLSTFTEALLNVPDKRMLHSSAVLEMFERLLKKSTLFAR
ncbi:hypothetical protein LTS10_010541 [Elasticomyces elasticus]|nr:hypothetical protein LTS10_010541 [Elasticomyces elasticus]